MDIHKLLKLPPAPSTPFGIGKDYRFRKVAQIVPTSAEGWGWQTDDLAPFVDLSDQSTDIAASHESLKGATRHELYERWHAQNSDAFLILDHRENGQWKPVAVSIILPLTQHGYDALNHGEKDAVGLSAGDMANGAADASHLLLDTWIIDEKHRHGDTSGYGEALLTKHLSQLWDPNRQPEISLSVEPDAASVRHTIERLEFEKSTAPGSNFYARAINTREAGKQPLLQQFIRNIETCRQWPCIGETPSAQAPKR